MKNYRPLISEMALDRKRDVYEMLELFDERAGIREFDGMQRRDVAEHCAYLDVKSYMERM